MINFLQVKLFIPLVWVTVTILVTVVYSRETPDGGHVMMVGVSSELVGSVAFTEGIAVDEGVGVMLLDGGICGQTE